MKLLQNYSSLVFNLHWMHNKLTQLDAATFLWIDNGRPTSTCLSISIHFPEERKWLDETRHTASCSNSLSYLCDVLNRRACHVYQDLILSKWKDFILLIGARAVYYSAEQVYNTDENGITTVQKPHKILAREGSKQVDRVVSAEKSSTTTVICAMCATCTTNVRFQ